MNHLINEIRNISYCEANTLIRQISGIVDFFASESEKIEFVTSYDFNSNIVCEDRVSYGDWQTPLPLAEKVCQTHALRYGNPDIVIEPTCGLGAFVISAIRLFPNLSEIHAIEINRQYTNELKLKLLTDALSHCSGKHPDIYIYNADFFEFDFSSILQKCKLNNWNLAVIGNPPWVTNSIQGKKGSGNLPVKSNNYGLKGIDAITGKSNFDISENISLSLLKLSHQNKGGLSFLLKNSVIRNILAKQHAENIHIGEIEQRQIDASKEFDVSVDASCFSAKFNCPSAYTCTVRDFYTDKILSEYGWDRDSFVSDLKLYRSFSRYDNTSSYVWRSGIKHDCAPVLELTFSAGQFVNGYGETVKIEEDLIFPLLKSSDIGKYQEDNIRKYILVPQRKVGDDTSLLKQTHPLAYSYLTKHGEAFNSRKSSIYKNKDKFSIFGIGDYSFKPYKIIVSSLYKTIKFILVSPCEGKPIMVDDTCYQLDFDNLEEATCIYEALGSDEIRSLLQSIVFKDAKRVVTKSILMRLDLAQLCRDMGMARFMNKSSRQPSLFN